MNLEITAWEWRLNHRLLVVEMNTRYILFYDREPFSRKFSFDTVIMGEKISPKKRQEMIDLFVKEHKDIQRKYPNRPIEVYYRNRYIAKFGGI